MTMFLPQVLPLFSQNCLKKRLQRQCRTGMPAIRHLHKICIAQQPFRKRVISDHFVFCPDDTVHQTAVDCSKLAEQHHQRLYWLRALAVRQTASDRGSPRGWEDAVPHRAVPQKIRQNLSLSKYPRDMSQPFPAVFSALSPDTLHHNPAAARSHRSPAKATLYRHCSVHCRRSHVC